MLSAEPGGDPPPNQGLRILASLAELHAGSGHTPGAALNAEGSPPAQSDGPTTESVPEINETIVESISGDAPVTEEVIAKKRGRGRPRKRIIEELSPSSPISSPIPSRKRPGPALAASSAKVPRHLPSSTPQTQPVDTSTIFVSKWYISPNPAPLFSRGKKAMKVEQEDLLGPLKLTNETT